VKIADVANSVEELSGVRRFEQTALPPEWRRHGRLIARQLDGDHLVIRVDFEFRESLVQSDPVTFSVQRRYVKHMMVVAEFASGDAAEIKDALDVAWPSRRSAD
jgi:hypothetical protein